MVSRPCTAVTGIMKKAAMAQKAAHMAMLRTAGGSRWSSAGGGGGGNGVAGVGVGRQAACVRGGERRAGRVPNRVRLRLRRPVQRRPGAYPTPPRPTHACAPKHDSPGWATRSHRSEAPPGSATPTGSQT